MLIRLAQPKWGIITISLTIVPALLGLLFPTSWKAKFLNALYHLPGIQVFKHFVFQKEITKESQKKAKNQRKSILIRQEINQLEKKLESIVDSEEMKKCQKEIEAKKVINKQFLRNVEIAGVRQCQHEAELQQFKALETFGENYPQLILQNTILLKGGNWTTATFFTLFTSLLGVFTTMGGLTVSLPFFINGKPRIQFKDLKLTFAIVTPLIVFVVVPRIFTLSTFCSLFGAKTEEEVVRNEFTGLGIMLIFFLMYVIGFKMIVYRTFKNWKRTNGTNGQASKTVFARIMEVLLPSGGLPEEASEYIRKSFLSSLLIPTTIFNPHMSLYRDFNILTTLLYSLLSFVSLILITFFEKHINMPTKIDKLTYQIIVGVQVGALMIGFAASYAIFYIIKKYNMPNLFLWAYEDEDQENFNEMFGQTFDHNAINREGKNVVLLSLERQDKSTFTWICAKGPPTFDFNATDENGKTCLIWAIQQGMTDSVKKVLPKLEIKTVNKKDSKGWNALMYSIVHKQTDILASLLDIEGIDVHTPSDEDGRTCLMWATELKLNKAIQSLLPKLSLANINALDNSKHNALMYAWKHGQLEVVQTLLKVEGIVASTRDPDEEDGRTCLIWAVENDHDQIVLMLLPILNTEELNHLDWHGRSPFMLACIFNSVKVVQVMLEHSAKYKIDVHKVDQYERSAFMHACSSNADKVVLYLLQNNFKFSIKTNTLDVDGWNCFLWACQGNAHRVVPILLEQAQKYKINIHASDKIGQNGFMIACNENRDKVAKILIEQSRTYEIPLNQKDARNNSAFILACRSKHFRIVKLLTEKAEEFKIDLKGKNRDGKSGYDLWPQHFKKQKK